MLTACPLSAQLDLAIMLACPGLWPERSPCTAFKMAALAKNISSRNLRQFAVRFPTALWRLTSSSSTTDGSDPPHVANSSSPTEIKEVTDISTYKVKEYYSYDEYSFYDLENVIDATGKRQMQPNPMEKYTHTNPWTT